MGQTNIPQLVSFSALVRDANNQPLVNTPVSIRLTFKEGGQTGPLVYCALHQTTTNQNGFMSLQLNRDVLGTGCNGAPSTLFEDIPWENGGFWMEVEYQVTPGDPFENLGQLELASSFYAFAAGTAESISGMDLSGANDGDVLTYNITTGQWEPLPTSGGFSGDYLDLSNQPTTVDSISTMGDSLYLSNGQTFVSNTNIGSGFTHYIGEEFGGGVIFHLWLDAQGIEHGLIVDKTDLSNSQAWSNIYTTLIGPSAQSTWDGLSNSNAIVGQAGHTSSAAALCLNSTNGGQSDWYLPSMDELSLLWHSRFNVNKTLSAIGGATVLPISANCWSSTEKDGDSAWSFRFGYGNPNLAPSKGYITYVRAVRAF